MNRIFEILGKNFDLLIPKYNDVNMPLKESASCSKSITDLKLVMTTAEFLKNFSESKKLVLETDKCDVELYSIEELKDFLKLLTKQQINNIEWKFKNR